MRIFLCIIKKNCRLCDGRFSISMKYIERTLVEMSGINFPNRLNRKGVFLSSNMYNYINPTGFETCSYITNRVNFNNGLF